MASVADLQREFLTWLRASGQGEFEAEALDAEGESYTIAIPAAALARHVASLSNAEFDALVEASAAPAVGTHHSIEVPEGHAYDTWTEAKRRKANIAAIVALRRYQESGRNYLTPEERAALQAFSGWGGIKISRLPDDASIWPPDFLVALQDFQAARKERRVPAYDTFRGLLQQFFTPVTVAEFMGKLAMRAVRRPVQTILEPSAGVGRFVGALKGAFGNPAIAPDDALYFMAEYDALLAQIEGALFPDSIRAASAFEIVGRRLETATQGPFDVVISNPPYPRRSAPYRNEHGQDWSRAAAYFTWASMRLLAPGGVLCTLVPIGQMTAPDNDAVALRRFLLQEAELVNVVPLPVDVFPGALVQTVVHTWVKRPQPLTTEEVVRLMRTDEAAGAIVKGRTVPKALGTASTFGVWQQSTRWKTDLELRSNGVALDVDALTLLPVTTPVQPARSETALETLTEILQKTAAAASQMKLGQAVLREAHAEAGTALSLALALEVRLLDFLTLRAHADTQVQAETRRPELLGDVEAFIETWGNPHRLDVLNAHRRQVSTLLAVVAESGQITDVLRDAVTDDIVGSAELGRTDDITAIVTFYCERLGSCPESKLDRHMTAVPEYRDLPESICLWVEPHGEVRLFTKDAYLSGALYPRIDNVKAVLAGEPEDWLQTRMYRQREWLIEALGERSITEIEITPSSGFLMVPGDDPWAILNEYIAWKMEQLNSTRSPCKVTLKQQNRRFYIEREGNWPDRPTDTLRVEKAIVREDYASEASYREAVCKENEAQRGAKKYPSAWIFILRLLGYLNDDQSIPDPDGGSMKESSTQRYSSTDFEVRRAEDEAIVEDFRSWLVAQEKWHEVIATQYNRAYRGYAAGVPSDKPIPIARWCAGLSVAKKLDPHQNQGVRWFAARGTGIVAFNVGLGKCRRATSPQVTQQGVVAIGDLVGQRPELPEGAAETIPVSGLMVPVPTAGGVEWLPVAALYRQRLGATEATWKITTTRGGGDEVTAAHRFRGVDPVTGELAWRYAKDLKAGDFLVAAPDWQAPAPQWPEAVHGWGEDRRLALVRALVWMLTEGHEVSSRGNQLVVTQKDAGARQAIRDALACAFACPVRETVPEDHHAPYLSITSAEVRALCLQVGYPWAARSADRRLPSWMFTLSEAHRALIASILMDAEGCVVRGGVEWTSASHQLAEDTRTLLGSLGIVSTLRPRKVKGYAHTYWRLTLFSDAAARFADQVGFRAYPDKQARLREQLATTTRNPNRAGIPCAWLSDLIRQTGLPLPGAANRNAVWARGHAEEVLAALEYRLSPKGLAAWERDAGDGQGTARRWARVGLAALAQHHDTLQKAAEALRALLVAPYEFVAVEAVEPGEVGGYVYDLSVATEDPEKQCYVAGGGGLVQHNTYTGLASIAWERQNGRARRALVLVPDALVINWYREAKAVLPDYRVGTIGYEVDPKDEMSLREVPNDRRAVQWKRAALGAYEIVIVGYVKFLRDVALGADEARRHLEKLAWLQSGQAEDDEKLALLERKIAEATKRLSVWTSVVSRAEAAGQSEVNIGSQTISLEAAQRTVVRLQTELDALTKEAAALGGEVSDGTIETVRDRVESLIASLRPRGAEAAWRASDGKGVLAAHLLSVLVKAGGGSAAEGAKAKFKDTEWAADYKANAKDLAGWFKKVAKRVLVAMLEEFDPVDYVAAEESPVPPMIGMEALGIDLLVVDEAHNFKNLFAPKRQPYGATSVAYMGPPPGDTQRCWDLWVKTQYILERHQERGVLLLTATPEKNSPLEVYNLINYVSRDCWTSRGIGTPEDFVKRYIIVDKAWVPRPNRGDDSEAATEVIHTEAVVGFKSQLELWVARDQFTLARTVDDVPTLKARVPESVEFRVDFDLDPTQYQLYEDTARTIRDLQAEEKVKEADGEGKADPSLGLRRIDLLTKIALDPRLLLENYEEVQAKEAEAPKRAAKHAAWVAAGGKGKPPPRPFSDTQMLSIETSQRVFEGLSRRCAERLGRDVNPLQPPPLPDMINALFPKAWIPPKYRELAKQIQLRGTSCGHIVFTDTTDAIFRIQTALVSLGMDRDRIGIMAGAVAKTAAARQALMDAFNGTLKYDAKGNEIPGSGDPPEIDILIGTSALMGEGANLQVRTCVVHHVTLPWDPASIEQRNGRAVRQGNVLKLRDDSFTVSLLFYLARYTTDAQKYDAILGKGAWQALLRVPDAADREDVVENPAASFERVTRILALAEQDPDRALATLETAKAQYEVARAAKIRKDIVKRLQNLEATARRVRGAYNPLEREMQARQYNAKAAQLLKVGGEIAVNLHAAILAILERPTYYDMGSGLIVRAGDHIEVSLANHYKSRVVVTNTGMDGYFEVRAFGALDTKVCYNLRQVALADYSNDYAADREAEVTVTPITWDAAEDANKTLENVFAAYDTTKTLLGRSRALWERLRGMGLQRVWQYPWTKAPTSLNYMVVPQEPPIPVTYGDSVLLVTRDAIKGWVRRVGVGYSTSGYINYTQDVAALYDWLRRLEPVESLDRFIEALSEDRVYVLDSSTTAQDLVVDIDTFPELQPWDKRQRTGHFALVNLWDSDQRGRAEAIASVWYGTYLRPEMVKSIKAAIRRHRKALGGVLPPMSTADMRAEAEDQP